MNNPFILNGVAAGARFCDRENETDNITANLWKGHHIFLHAPRHYGKTSLAHHVMSKLPLDHSASFMDLSHAHTGRNLIEIIVAALFTTLKNDAPQNLELLKSWSPLLAPFLYPAATASGQITPGFRPGALPAPQILRELLDRLDLAVTRMGMNHTMMLDNCRQLSLLPPHEKSAILDSLTREYDSLTFLLIAREEETLTVLIPNPENPWRQKMIPLPLSAPPQNLLTLFLLDRFHDSGKAISLDAAILLAELSRSQPAALQTLAHTVWDFTARDILACEDDVTAALQKILKRTEPAFHNFWEHLSPTAREILGALAQNPLYPTFSQLQNQTEPHLLNSELTELSRRGVIHAAAISDPFLLYRLKTAPKD